MHHEHYTDLDNLDTVENNLRHSAKESNDAYDVPISLTGYEPNYMAFSELNDSQGSFSYITPSSGLDIDNTTLGKLLTEAHREHADYRNPEGVSVSQSSLSVVFDRTGKLVGERNVDQSIGFGVTRNTYSAHSKFSESTQAEKMVDRTGKLVGENSSNAQIRTLLEEQRQMIIAECCEKIGHHELQAARAEEERPFLREEHSVSKKIFVKFINKVLVRWRNYENSRVLQSIRSQDESSSRTRTLMAQSRLVLMLCHTHLIGSRCSWVPLHSIVIHVLLEFAESGHPIFRATTPLSRGQLKSKGRGKLSIHFAADQDTIDTIYRIILSVNQLSVYGAVAAVCEEFENHQDRTGELVILMGQSIVLGEVKAEAPLHDENPMNDQIIWQQYIQQVESLSPENIMSKFCKEAGFMRVV